MKKTKKQPVLISIVYPDGVRIEARITLWKAYAIMAAIEHEKSMKANLEKEK